MAAPWVRARQAVQDARGGYVVSVVALVLAVLALAVAIVRR